MLFASGFGNALAMRRKWFDPALTNAYRLINAEGDGIPGLIVDSYDGVLVMQISHPGIESIRELILSLSHRRGRSQRQSMKNRPPFYEKKRGWMRCKASMGRKVVERGHS